MMSKNGPPVQHRLELPRAFSPRLVLHALTTAHPVGAPRQDTIHTPRALAPQPVIVGSAYGLIQAAAVPPNPIVPPRPQAQRLPPTLIPQPIPPVMVPPVPPVKRTSDRAKAKNTVAAPVAIPELGDLEPPVARAARGRGRPAAQPRAPTSVAASSSKAAPKPKAKPAAKRKPPKTRVPDINELLINCGFCASPVPHFDSLTLESCGHIFCRNCLENYVSNSKEAQIPCPIKEEAECNGFLSDPEIKTLIPEELFQEYLSRSMKNAMMEDAQLAHCFAEGCAGMGFIEGGLRIFYCPTCGVLNCIECKSTHDRPCKRPKRKFLENGLMDSATGGDEDLEEDFQIAMKLPVQETEEEAKIRLEWEASWEQLRKKFTVGIENQCGANGNAADTVATAQDGIWNAAISRLDILNQLILTDEEFECPVCFADVGVGQGVLLQECFHRFCRECLAATVEHSEEARVKCPSQTGNFSCQMYLLDREVKALVSQDIYDKLLTKSLSTAEMGMKNSFHCQSVNCTGWVEVDAQVSRFACFICQKQNCIPCKAIHEAITCEDYQLRLKGGEHEAATTKAVNDMIAKGQAMRCPTCKVLIIKNGGCDGMQCSVCRTHLCWATKGPRWGATGQGDTTGGCRCMFDGKRCHPSCQNCH